MIDQILSNDDLGVQILVAGPNGHKHSVYTILNPGTVHNNSAIGHGAIGTGAPHALYSLIADNYSFSMNRQEVEELVEKAKNRSEVAPGVGSQTTSIVIPKSEEVEDEQSTN